MTKEEAIDLLDNLIGMVEDNHNSDYDMALKMGIKALEQERSVITELEKIIDKINYEGKWLVNVKMENGFISITDIQIAMSGIIATVSELKEAQHD